MNPAEQANFYLDVLIWSVIVGGVFAGLIGGALDAMKAGHPKRVYKKVPRGVLRVLAAVDYLLCRTR